MPFGQVVVGAPGSGKTVYCNGMQQFLRGLKRKVTVVNLDPANHLLPYDCSVDLQELITLEDVMAEFKLGPNGGLMYCMEYLEKNIDWLFAQLDKLDEDYLLFDFPGQVELYTHHDSVCNIVHQLEKKGYRLACVNLIDSHYCSSAVNFISAAGLSLSIMLQIELPHVNVLSKIDLVESMGKLDFSLQTYTDARNLSILLQGLESNRFAQRYKRMTEAFVDVVEGFGLVSFLPLNIQEKESVWTVVKAIDRANGHAYAGMASKGPDLNVVNDSDFDYYRVAAVQEKYMSSDPVQDVLDEHLHL